MKKVIDFLINIPLILINPSRILKLFRVRNLDERTNKILANDNVVKIISFVAAVVFVTVIRFPTNDTPAVNNETFTIPLEKILSDEYTDFGSIIPSQVEITLSGNPVDINMFRLTADLFAIINLDALGPGEHSTVVLELPVEIPATISAVLNPPVINNIEIARIEEEIFPVVIFANFPELAEFSRYEFSEPVANPSYVTVRGPRRILNEIEEVLARLTILPEQVEPGVIDVVLEVVPQNNFDRIRGVVIDYDVVTVSVEIYDRTRNASVIFDENILNFPRLQYEVNDISIDIPDIIVWGDFEALLSWEYFDVMTNEIMLPRINFRELSVAGERIFILNLPFGVYTEIDGAETSTLIITVTVDYEEVPQEDDDEDEEDEN